MAFSLFSPDEVINGCDSSSSGLIHIHVGPMEKAQAESLSKLHVPWQTFWKDDEKYPSVLLGWQSRISSFAGRAKEMDELGKWALAPGFISVNWITGKGGMGKSRLAAEFAIHMTEEHQWTSGFVDLSEPKTFDLEEEGLLMIIDYPEDNIGSVTAFLRDLAEADRKASAQQEKKIRVLFLSRRKFADWQPIVFKTGIESLAHPYPVELTNFSFEAANEIYFSGLSNVSQLIGEPDPSTHGDSRESWFQNSERNRRPQYAVAAAVFKAFFPVEDLRKNDVKRIIEKLAHYAISGAEKMAFALGSNDPSILPILQAASNICGGLEWEQADRIIRALGLEKAVPEGKDLKVFFPEGRMAPIGTDTLAAAYTVEVLWQKPQMAPEIIWLSLGKDFSASLTRFSRLCQEAEKELDFPRNQLSQWLVEAISESPDKAVALEPFLANDLYGLSWAGIKACRTCLDRTETEIEKMRLHAKLSLFFQASGDGAEALKQRIFAVDICEILASDQPEAYEPELVGQYFDLWQILFNTGESRKAYRVIERAAELFEKLAPSHPRKMKLNLAKSLENLGNAYAEGNELEKALTATEKALAAYGELVSTQPLVFGPPLAACFNNQSNLYAQLGETENALSATGKAIKIYEQLTTSKPEIFESDLAASLTNLGNRYVETGETEKALKTIQRALEIYEKLAAAQPEVYSGDLAGCLNIEGNLYAFMEEDDKALEITERVVEIYSRISKETAMYDSLLASSLNNLSSRYAKAGEDAKALVATDTAVKIYDSLAEAYPMAFDPHLATALNNLAMRQAAVGETKKALSATEKAIEIYSRLVAAQPEIFEPDLAGCLNNQGNLFANIGDLEKAIVATEMAVEIKEQLASANPQSFVPSLVKSLKNLEQRYADIGEKEKARIVRERAKEIREKYLYRPF